MYQLGLGRQFFPVTHCMAAGDKRRVEKEVKECFFLAFLTNQGHSQALIHPRGQHNLSPIQWAMHWSVQHSWHIIPYLDALNTMLWAGMILLFPYTLGHERESLDFTDQLVWLRSGLDDSPRMSGIVCSLQWALLISCSGNTSGPFPSSICDARVVSVAVASVAVSWDTLAEVSDGRIYQTEQFVFSLRRGIRFWNADCHKSRKQGSIFSRSSPKFKAILLNPSWGSSQTINTPLLHYTCPPNEHC